MDGETTTHISILPWPSGAPTSDPARVVFDRKELALLLSVYGRKVAAGEWRDYALQFGKDAAVFCAYRRAADYPSARLEKRPALRNKQGMWVLYGEAGQILKRGHELPGVLAVLERRLLKLVES